MHEHPGVLTPSGYYVVCRPYVGKPGWVVMVYDFATWKHREYRYDDEAAAKRHFIQWLL